MTENRPEYCPRCGAKVPESGAYCPECGADLLAYTDADADPTTDASPDSINRQEHVAMVSSHP
jgi:predicted amidophosphoribosyltransferase